MNAGRTIPLAPFTDLIADCAAKGVSVRLRATGGSMAPAIIDGEVITLTPAEVSDIAVGDVVAARVDGEAMVIHRVVALRDTGGKRGFALRGDRCSGEPELVGAPDILGVVDCDLSRPRRLMRACRSQVARLARVFRRTTDHRQRRTP